jgi:type VI secretion system protein ImpH
LYLGQSAGVLGRDGFVGEEIQDRMGKFRLEIGPVDREQFQTLLPGGKGCEKLSFLTKFYVADAFEYDVELTLAEREAQSVCLGHPEWSRLGWDTWIFSGEDLGKVSATYYPDQRIS